MIWRREFDMGKDYPTFRDVGLKDSNMMWTQMRDVDSLSSDFTVQGTVSPNECEEISSHKNIQRNLNKIRLDLWSIVDVLGVCFLPFYARGLDY